MTSNCKKIQYLLLTIVILASLSLSLSARADSEEIVRQLLYLDRVAMALTGLPANAEMRQDLRTGRKSFDQILESMKTSQGFERRFAQYWLQILKINNPVNWTKMGGQYLNGAPPKPVAMDNMLMQGGKNLGYHQRPQDCFQPGQDRFVYDLPSGLQFNDPDFNGTNLPIIDKATNFAYESCGCLNKKAGDPPCPEASCKNIVKVKPFWSPTREVKVCRGLVEDVTYTKVVNGVTTNRIIPARCGSDLSKCWLYEESNTNQKDRGNTFIKDISYGFTMEPGILIARTVANDRSWDDVLISSKGYINGPIAKFLGPNPVNLDKFSQTFLNYYAPRAGTVQSYPDRASFSQYPVHNWDSFYEVERGPGLHEGVLTTLAFHRVTNGWRAKANRAMGAFLCREFKTPENALQPKNDITDLTKKPYCKFCHTTLEPMSQFFANWPNLGEASYSYNAAVLAAPNRARPNDLHNLGTFNGQSGNGVEALAKIFIAMPDYNECAVRRAFNFIVGRDFSPAEEEMMLPPLVRKFEQEDKRLWPIMMEILRSPTFKEGVPK